MRKLNIPYLEFFKIASILFQYCFATRAMQRRAKSKKKTSEMKIKIDGRESKCWLFAVKDGRVGGGGKWKRGRGRQAHKVEVVCMISRV